MNPDPNGIRDLLAPPPDEESPIVAGETPADTNGTPRDLFAPPAVESPAANPSVDEPAAETASVVVFRRGQIVRTAAGGGIVIGACTAADGSVRYLVAALGALNGTPQTAEELGLEAI